MFINIERNDFLADVNPIKKEVAVFIAYLIQ